MVFWPSNWKVARTVGVPPLNDAGGGVGWGAVYWKCFWSFLGNDSPECFHSWCSADYNPSWEHLNRNKKAPGHSDGLWEGGTRRVHLLQQLALWAQVGLRRAEWSATQQQLKPGFSVFSTLRLPSHDIPGEPELSSLERLMNSHTWQSLIRYGLGRR